MSEPIFSLEEIAEAFKYIQDNKLSIDAKAMLTMDIGYEKAEKDIVKLLEEHKGTYLTEEVMYCCDGGFDHAIALIKGEK